MTAKIKIPFSFKIFAFSSKAIFLTMAFFLSFLPKVKAEYRVYQYILKARHAFSLDKNSYMVTSTLDPQSYLAYHGGNSTLSVDLIRTWMCKGNTANQEYCESPYSQLQREQELQQKLSQKINQKINQKLKKREIASLPQNKEKGKNNLESQ